MDIQDVIHILKNIFIIFRIYVQRGIGQHMKADTFIMLLSFSNFQSTKKETLKKVAFFFFLKKREKVEVQV